MTLDEISEIFCEDFCFFIIIFFYSNNLSPTVQVSCSYLIFFFGVHCQHCIWSVIKKKCSQILFCPRLGDIILMKIVSNE